MRKQDSYRQTPEIYFETFTRAHRSSEKNMKILQLGKAYPPVNLGGVEVVIALFCTGLVEKGYRCDALGVNDRYQFVKEKNGETGYIYRTKLILKAFSTLLSFQLITFLNKIKNDYDIIHIHSPDPMAALALFICRPSCKVVLHWHSDILRQKLLLFFYNPMLKWLVRRADLILATSPKYIEGSSYLLANKSKTKVLPIGLNIPPISYTKKTGDQLNEKYGRKQIIFSLGRLAYYKGYEYLILAARYLPLDTVIVIAGEGNERTRLETLIKQNNLSDKVQLIGKITQAEKEWFFENCSLFALSSIYKTEAYAIVQVEAMAYGKPVISTIIEGSGVDWVNKDKVSGVTVPPKDPKELANAINLLSNNPGLYLAYSKGAIKRYIDNFTEEIMIDLLIKYYNRLSN